MVPPGKGSRDSHDCRPPAADNRSLTCPTIPKLALGSPDTQDLGRPSPGESIAESNEPNVLDPDLASNARKLCGVLIGKSTDDMTLDSFIPNLEVADDAFRRLWAGMAPSGRSERDLEFLRNVPESLLAIFRPPGSGKNFLRRPRWGGARSTGRRHIRRSPFELRR